ncbi:hypothetical protein ABFP60_02930 [Clostridioides difficile]
MKRNKIIGMLLITAMIFSIGCTNNSGSSNEDTGIKSKEIVFEENVMESSNTSIKITQEEINFNTPENTRFDFRFFNNDKIYGSLSTMVNEYIDLNKPVGYSQAGVCEENLYVVDEEFNVNKTESKLLVKDENEGVKGINSQYYGINRHAVNYYNYETNELVEVTRKKYDAFEAYVFNSLHNGIEVAHERLIKGNDNFGYVVYNYSKNEERLVQLQIIDIKNSKLYTYEVKGEDVDFIIDVVFDKKSEDFYAIGNKGIIYNLDFKNDEILLEEKEKLDFSGIALWDENQIYINEDGEIIIMYKFISNQYAVSADKDIEIGQTLDDTVFARPMYDERVMGDSKDSNELLITYNPSTNNVKRIMQNADKNYEVVSFLGESNLCLLEKNKQDGYGQEFYIGELKDDRIEIYNKIELDTKKDENVWVYNYITNESNSEVLINFRVSNLSGCYSYDWKNIVIKINIER